MSWRGAAVGAVLLGLLAVGGAVLFLDALAQPVRAPARTSLVVPPDVVWIPASPRRGAAVTRPPAIQRWGTHDDGAADTTLPAADVRVHVENEDGTPAAGAAVTAGVSSVRDATCVLTPAVTTDAGGDAAVLVPGRPADAAVVLLASTERTAAIAGVEPGTADVAMRLSRAVAVRGRVVDDAGSPVGAAHVEISFDGAFSDVEIDPVAALTRDDGWFALPPLPVRIFPEMTAVTATAEGHAPGASFARDPVDGIQGTLTITAERIVRVRGRCVDPQGRPLGGVRVQIGLDQNPHETSGADGRFDLHGLPHRGGDLILTFAGCAIARRDAIRGDAGDADVGDVAMDPGVTVRGVVVDGDGRPVADATVTVQEIGAVVPSAATGSDGRFVVEHVRAGRHTIVVQAPSDPMDIGARRIEVPDVDVGKEELRIVFSGSKTLHVRLIDAVTREAVVAKRASVTWSKNGVFSRSHGGGMSAGDRSEIRSSMPTSGGYTITITVDDASPVTFPDVDISDERETVLDVPLTPAK